MPLTNLKVCLTDKDRNVFSILVRVAQTLRLAGHADLARQFQEKAIQGDYRHVLWTAREYVVVEGG